MSDIHRMLLGVPEMVYIPDGSDELFMLDQDRKEEGMILVIGDFHGLEPQQLGGFILAAMFEGKSHFIPIEEMS